MTRTLTSILLLLILGGIIWNHKQAWSGKENLAFLILVICIICVFTSHIEAFADQSADEAGLVFGIPPSTMSAAALTLYSGNTLAFLSTAKQYLGRSNSNINNPKFLLGMNDVTNVQNILPNLRIQFLDQSDFSSLYPIYYGEIVSILHQNDGKDKCLSVEPASGIVQYNSDLATGKSYGLFKLFNAIDVNDGGLVSIQNKVLIRYVGDGAAVNSFVQINSDGAIRASATLSDATIFTIQTCIGTRCGGPNWRFQ